MPTRTQFVIIRTLHREEKTPRYAPVAVFDTNDEATDWLSGRTQIHGRDEYEIHTVFTSVKDKPFVRKLKSIFRR